MSKPEREIGFHQDFYFVLRKLIESQPEIAGYKFSSVRMKEPVDSGEADIIIYGEAKNPFIVIETKRKDGRVSRNIDPLNSRVIQQALGYASLLGASYIVTANAAFLASFVRPERRDERFSIERHRVLITQIQVLNEAFVRAFLETIVKHHRAVTLEEKARFTTGLDWTFIFRLRSFVAWLSIEVEPVIRSRFRIDHAFRKKVREFEHEKGVKLNPKNLSQQMCYILTNKIVFYKVLERKHAQLPKLLDIKVPRPRLYLSALYALFDTAIGVTGNFEAVFKTGLFDNIVLPDQPSTLLDILDGLRIFVTDMETYPLEKLDALTLPASAKEFKAQLGANKGATSTSKGARLIVDSS